MVSRLAALGREGASVADSQGDVEKKRNNVDRELSPHTSDKACIAGQTKGMFRLDGASLVM